MRVVGFKSGQIFKVLGVSPVRRRVETQGGGGGGGVDHEITKITLTLVFLTCIREMKPSRATRVKLTRRYDSAQSKTNEVVAGTTLFLPGIYLR